MAGFELNSHDRHRITQAREALAFAEALDWTDGQMVARVHGRLEVAVKNLLAVFDEHEAGDE